MAKLSSADCFDHNCCAIADTSPCTNFANHQLISSNCSHNDVMSTTADNEVNLQCLRVTAENYAELVNLLIQIHLITPVGYFLFT